MQVWILRAERLGRKLMPQGDTVTVAGIDGQKETFIPERASPQQPTVATVREDVDRAASRHRRPRLKRPD